MTKKILLYKRGMCMNDKKKSLLYYPIITGVAVLIIWAVICAIIEYATYKISDRISDNIKNEVVTSVKSDLKEYIDLKMKSNVGEDSNDEVPNEEKEVSKGEQDEDIKIINVSLTSTGMSSIKTEVTNGISCLAFAPTWKSTDEIAQDVTGNTYKAKELSNQKLLIPYMENGQEVYFYGQFNSNNHWDGDCIINVYEDDKLVMIHEANYDNGKLEEYRQVFIYNNQRNKKVWAISKRKVAADGNVGNTWTYFFDEDVKKDLDIVKKDQILGISDFKASKELKLEGFYHGKTKDGKFEDDSRDAYIIKYNKNGKIRLFYTGVFKDGTYEDSSGKAWHIVSDDDTKCYTWQKGYFSGGHIDRSSIVQDNYPLTMEMINKYIKRFKVNEKYLTWKKSYIKSSKRSNK